MREAIGPGRMLALVGPPAAGKSALAAWIAEQVPGAVVLSLDAQRARWSQWGDEADQAATPIAVRMLHIELEEHLADQRLVVVDATNSTAAHRQDLLEIATAAGARSSALLVLPWLQDCLARNARRSAVVGACGYARRVPAETVKAMHEQITHDQQAITSEGWAEVHRLTFWDCTFPPQVLCPTCGGDASVLADDDLFIGCGCDYGRADLLTVLLAVATPKAVVEA